MTASSDPPQSGDVRFRVDLSMFCGPLDLLLYLVRKHELDVTDIPIAKVVDQYLKYLTILEQIDVNAVGEFLELASRLIEIKSRLVLPSGDETAQEVEDPRHELVRKLLEYKEYRDAASMLEERGRQWRDRYPRSVSETPGPAPPPEEQPIHNVELWDLVSALRRLMQEKAAPEGPKSIRYDDTPIRVYMRRIYDRVAADGQVAFSQLFGEGAHRSTVIGMFLALLELIRHHWMHAHQAELFDDIWLACGDRALPADFASNDAYDGRTTTAEQSVSEMRQSPAA